MTTTPRYDTHADWYLDYTRDWASVLGDHLPQSLAGQRILDLCCGYGTLSRTMADRGAEVVGVDDLDAVLASASRVLAPSGLFSFAIFHPCFPGDAGSRPSWPEAGYSQEGWWNTGQSGVRGHVGAHHRTLSTYLNSVIGAGLELVRASEPPARVPTLLIIDTRAKRQA